MHLIKNNCIIVLYVSVRERKREVWGAHLRDTSVKATICYTHVLYTVRTYVSCMSQFFSHSVRI